jgi:hypothetical protein
MQVAVALVKGSLVHICQPRNGNKSSLSIMFPEFASALCHVSVSLLEDSVFFRCLLSALMRRKTKLSRPTHNAVIGSWLGWLVGERKADHDNDQRHSMGSMTSAAHACLIYLMTEWVGLGNVLLPRDKLLNFSIQVVQAADCAFDRCRIWQGDFRVSHPFVRIAAAPADGLEYGTTRSPVLLGVLPLPRDMEEDHPVDLQVVV